jgi:hypothetical protein
MFRTDKIKLNDLIKEKLRGELALSKLTSLNNDRYISLKECLQYKALKKYQIPVCLGRDSNGEIQIKDFVDIGNLLLSGMTSSGKSMFINSFICTILLTKEPEELKFIMIDLKQIELHSYNGIAHLLHPVCKDGMEAIQLIDWCIEEIDRRKTEKKKRPYIVVVMDEFSDLMLCDNRTNSKLEKIARDGNEVGMFMLLSASVPRNEVFTPEIKNAIPKRLVGALATNSDSREILDEGSATDLLGHGDMIYKNIDSGEKLRIQAPFVSTEDQMLIISSIPKVTGYKEIELEELEEEKDPLYEDAKRFVIQEKRASASLLQRRFTIGYNHAVRLMEQLERGGVISLQYSAKPRKVLIDKYEPPIEQSKKQFEKQNSPDGIVWLTKEQVKKYWGAKEEFPIKAIKVLPFLQSNIHHLEITPSNLVLGILKIYDSKDSEMVKTVYDVDISGQRRWYKDLLLSMVAVNPKEEFIENLILNLLFNLEGQYGNEYVLPLYKNAMLLFPTSKIFCDYISTMMNYLYDNPKERNEKVYKELQEIFKKIKKEEVEPRIWESMVLTNYCITDLLGNDKSKAPYFSDIKQENKLKAIKERSCFDILFGEEYI